MHFLVGNLRVGLGAGFVSGFKTAVDSGFGSGAGSGGSGHSSRTGDLECCPMFESIHKNMTGLRMVSEGS